jgi:hypothetical protein
MATVTLTYSDGTSETLCQPRQRQADRIAALYQAKIGHDFRLFNGSFTEDRIVQLVSVPA